MINDIKAYYKVEDNVYIELTKEEYYLELHKLNERLQERIEKAIEYINRNCISSDKWEDIGFCNFFPTGIKTYKQLSKTKVKELLDILKGEE